MQNVLPLAGIVAAFFVLLFALERLLPLRETTAALVGRLVVNLALSALAYAVAGLLVRPAVLAAIERGGEVPFGLLRWLDPPPLVAAVAGFLLLDLAFYYWHLVNHKVPWLWRFHNVHHLDPDLDVTTGFRFHAAEVAMSVVFRVIQVTLIGVSLPTLLVYETAFQLNTLFHHSNVRLPIRLERLLNLVLVTPRMHGIHHSQVCSEANANFSVVLAWWDRLHRTLVLNVPQARLEIGIAGYSLPEDNRLLDSLALPFRRQRDYWSTPDGTPVERDPAELGESPGRLAE